jgi:hypothetical protein
MPDLFICLLWQKLHNKIYHLSHLLVNGSIALSTFTFLWSASGNYKSECKSISHCSCWNQTLYIYSISSWLSQGYNTLVRKGFGEAPGHSCFPECWCCLQVFWLQSKVCFVCFFGDWVSLCSPDWPGTLDPPVSAYPVLGLEVYTTMADCKTSSDCKEIRLHRSHPEAMIRMWSKVHVEYLQSSHSTI